MNRTLLLLIYLWLLGIDDNSCAIATNAVYINDNITGNAYSNDISLKCSFTLENGNNLFAIALTAQNGTSVHFEEIAGFRIDTKLQLTSFGMDLFGNETTLIKFEATQNEFILVFNNLTCRHERQYKCFLYVTSSTILPKSIMSDTMWISVTVFPSKPKMHLPQKIENFTNAKRNTRLATLTPKTGIHKRNFTEGDNIAFLCEGDVGRPEGRFLWQKIFSSDEKFNYSNISTETIPESCSYEGNSTLTILVTGDDNQAIIRCIVKSELPNGTRHVDSEPLRIRFKVRKPCIELRPNKTVFHEGDSVQLNCKALGNPNPSYSWTKGNNSEEIIVDNETLIINNANISDGGLYTCDTGNSIDGNVYSESLSIYIQIDNISTTASSATIKPLGPNNTKDELILYIPGAVTGGILILIGIVIGICVYMAYTNRRLKKDNATPFPELFSVNYENDNRPSFIALSNYAKDDLEAIMNHRIDNTYDSSPDHYASSLPDIYDALHNNRHKKINGEKFDRTFEFKSLHENRKDSNNSIKHQVTTILDSHPINLQNSRRGGYESVVIDGDKPFISLENNGYGHDDLQTIRQHNEEYMHNQNKEDEKMDTSKSLIPNQTVEYAQVNEATKIRNLTKNNDTDRTIGNVSTGTQEGTESKSDKIHQEKSDYFNTPNNRKSGSEAESSNKRSQIRVINPQVFEHDGKEKEKIAIISPHKSSSIRSRDNEKNVNTNAAIHQGINDRSGQTVDNLEYFDTREYLRKQQSTGDPESPFKYNQTRMQINQAFEGDEHQEVVI